MFGYTRMQFLDGPGTNTMSLSISNSIGIAVLPKTNGRVVQTSPLQ